MPRKHLRRALPVTLLLAAIAVSTPTAAPGKPPAKHTQIAFRRFLDVDRTTSAIFVINPDGSGDRQVTQPPPGGLDDQPSWKPDGSRILFTRQPVGDDDGIAAAFWTVKPDGSKLKLLSAGCLGGPPRCLVNEQQNTPVYSPNGKLIAYGWAAGNVSDETGQIQFSEIYVMNADGSHPHPLTSFTKTAPYSEDTNNVAWSPDSKHLVFERSISPIGTPANSRALFIINADGSGLHQLTPWALRAGGRADWSSDGRRIVFRTVPENDEPGGDIYTIRPDRHGLRQLTHFAPDVVLGELNFSLDARWIVFAKGGETKATFVMRSNGTGIRRITHTELAENWADWGPRGLR